MKQIGHIDGVNAMPSTWKTHSLGMLSPHDLFIPNPGEREKISVDQWHHVGWVNPDKDGGCVWDTHAEAGDNSRPAYVRLEPVKTTPTSAPTEPENKPWKGVPDDPMDVRRSKFDQMREAVQTLEVKFQTLARIQQHGPLAPPESPMTFYDHAFLSAWWSLSASGYSDEIRATRAHELASVTIRYRQPKP